MATPLKKDFDRSEELTTADLAQGGKPVEPSGPKPVSSTRVSTPTGTHEPGAPLFPNNELEGLRTRWKQIQTNFVDEPRKAVEQADGLVASAMKRLAKIFADERSNLEKQWDKGDQVSTEDLRAPFNVTALSLIACYQFEEQRLEDGLPDQPYLLHPLTLAESIRRARASKIE